MSEVIRKKYKCELNNKYHKLTVLSRADNTKLQDAAWNCLCECGTLVRVSGKSLRSGHTKSCGCAMISGKLYYGQGIYNKGEYVTSINSIPTKEFAIWVKMIERCYSTRNTISTPTYVGCKVSDNFKDFQYFAEWCNNQIAFGLDGWQLDKDILGDGKLYSEDTCCFVPQHLNLLIMTSTVKRGKFPTGVTKRGDKYRANICYKGTRKYLGTFNTKEEASNAHKESKLFHIGLLIDELKDSLDEKVYLTLKSKSREQE